MKLSEAARGRDNNLHLIRIAAALAVLVTHSFALIAGTDSAEPLKLSLNTTLGSIAVDIFFAASGFLVAGSLLGKQDLIDYSVARCLRIYPALVVMVLLSVFVLGPVFTSLSWPAYLADGRTWLYLVRCMTLVLGVTDILPGVFDANPLGGVVNGSLWTMPYEVRMYLLLGAAWLMLARLRERRVALMRLLIVGYALLTGAAVLVAHVRGGSTGYFVSLSFVFFTGASFWVLREHIRLSWVAFGVLALALAASTQSREAFFWVYRLSIVYLVFFLAYVPGGVLRGYNRVGDYSYGVYIYAFPVQQALVAWQPDLSVTGMVVQSTLVTLALALVSWHVLEQPAMARRRDVTAALTRWWIRRQVR